MAAMPTTSSLLLRLLAASACCAVPVAQARAQWQDVLQPAGPQAATIASLWHVTLGLCTVVFLLTLLACAVALFRRRRYSAEAAAATPRLTWAIGWALGLSATGLLALFAADVVASRALDQLPTAGALQVKLTARQWWWQAQYHDPLTGQGFTTANELHLPVGRAVIIDLDSEDVIHSLWLPNLHGKLDLIPGKPAQLRLRADQAGTYRGQCAEFCGLEHARMALLVTAESPADYARWASGQARAAAPVADAAATVARGRAVFMERGCAQCHAIRGTDAAGQNGPDLTHLASRSTLAAGIFPNQRGFLAGWITDARSLKTGVIMPPAQLPPDELNALLDYLETLQ
ncbi:cytochrome c oxidase subunit II [Herbaspirillum seropedicae]|uniref:cytochrome c oxidase subunit II n=2 Tax=Herbaspirillum seropedicae TaxID=964 RepID=UPI000B1655D8